MINSLKESLIPLKNQLINHSLYDNLESIDDLKSFMESHIYAVWDFMSLVKKLQIELTTTTLPWYPTQNNAAARLINEIVWGEETDINKEGVPLSHFEMYLEAMGQINADTSGIKMMINNLKSGNTVFDAIEKSGLPVYICEFLNFTFKIIEEGKIHKIASVFTFGREDLIPDMFISIIKKMNRENDTKIDQIIYYFERHIEVDGDTHGPLAIDMIKNLCGTDPNKWNEAKEASQLALQKRIALWDGINKVIIQKENSNYA